MGQHETPDQVTSAGVEDETVTQTAISPTGLRVTEPPSGSTPLPAPNNLEIGKGTQIGDFVIDDLLGSGGCGRVYSAHHRETQDPVAIKVLRPEMALIPTVVPRFIREIEALSRLHHENIVKVIDTGELAKNVPYFVMERLEGMDVRQMLRIHGRFSPREALAILEPVGAALHAAHEKGVIHRDIKASNIFVCDDGGKQLVKLLDFGIAKMMHGEGSAAGLTAPGSVVGTPQAMAPEQIRSEILDARSDIYSVGALTYLLLTGSYPFMAKEAHEVTLMHLQAPAPRPSASVNVSREIDDVVLKCLHKKREGRFNSMPEFLTAMRSAVGDAPVTASGAESAPGVALHFEINSIEDEVDDDMIEDISNILDIIEEELLERDFVIALQTSNALTGLRLVVEQEGETEPYALAEADSAREEIEALLEEREDPHPSTVLKVSIQQDQVQYRLAGESTNFVGGPLLSVRTWTLQSHATPATAGE